MSNSAAKHNLFFLYASERGNSECISKQMHNDAVKTHNFPASLCMTLDEALKKKILEPAAVDADAVPEPTSPTSPLRPPPPEVTVVIVCSTTGDGDIPDNGGKFKRWLRNQTESLAHVRFTVLALGDTNYNAFCAAGKLIDAKLEGHGARRFYNRGEADDAFGLETVVDPWTTGLWPALANLASSALKETVIASEAPVVLDMRTPMATLVLFTPDMARVAYFLQERVWELGGMADVAPAQHFSPARGAVPRHAKLLVVLASVRDAQAGKLGVVGRLLAAAGQPAEPTPPSATHADDDSMLQWMRANLGVYATMTSASTLNLRDAGTADTGASLQLGAPPGAAEAAKQLHEQLTAWLGGPSLKLEALCKKQAEHFSPIASQLREHVLPWITVLLDCLPGVTADVASIRTCLEKSLHELTLESRAGADLGQMAAPSANTPSKHQHPQPHANPSSISNALVNNVLTPLVIMYSTGSSLIAEIAHSIHSRAAEKHSLQAAIVDTNNYKRVAFPRQATFVFVVGTVESSKSSITKLFKYIKSFQAEGKTMEKVRFAILGIDDQGAYVCALELELLLLALKATKVYCTGLVDTGDAATASAVTLLWENNLWGSLQKPQASSAYLDASVVTGMSKDGRLAEGGGSEQWFPWESLPMRAEAASTMSVLFLFSSSGMAKTFASQALREAELLGFDATLGSSRNFADAVPTQRFVIFFCDSSASTGATRMRRYLRKLSVSPDALSHLTYAVLGLGSAPATTGSSARHGNQHPAQEFASLLSHLQACRIFPVTTLDGISQLYSHGIPWSRGVLAAMTNSPQALSPNLGSTPTGAAGAAQTQGPLAAAQPGGVAPQPSLAANAIATRSAVFVDAPKVLFLFGSVTGTAEAVARDLHREALEHGCASRVAELQQFEKVNFTTSHLVVIVCCTTSVAGSCFPSNAVRFVKYISKSTLSSDHLSGTKFAVLGLGSSRYPDTFCKAAKSIDARLVQLGASRVLPIGLSDDTLGIETTVEVWRKDLLVHIKSLLAENSAPARTPQSSPSLGAKLADSPEMMGEWLPIFIFFASDPGGFAAQAASKLHGEVTGELYDAEMAPLGDFEKIGWRRFRVVVFMISCEIGQQAQDSSGLHHFLKFIRNRSHPHDLLSGLKYTVVTFDSAHSTHFCENGRYLDRRLEELGATRFYARGEVDHSFSNPEQLLEPWVSNLWPALRVVTAMPTAFRLTEASVPRGPGTTGSSECSSTDMAHRDASNTEPGGRLFDAYIKKWRLLSAPCAENHVILLSFGFAVPPVWSPGDAISILPKNSDADVTEILDLLGAPGEEIFLAQCPAGVTSHFPGSPIYSKLTRNFTNREVLTLVTSLRVGKINLKPMLALFRVHASNPSDQSILHSWLTSDFFGKQQLTLLEVLRKFDSSRPPFRHVVECLTPLQPRYYSVCSDCSSDPSMLEICFKVVPNGLCTTWLSQLCQLHTAAAAEGAPTPPCPITLPISLRDSSEFKLPQDPQIPLILIGPGTGVAPFLSFLQHRQHLVESGNQRQVGETHVFFGCRSKAEFLFKDELQRFVDKKVVHTLHVAFSQEPSEGMWYGGCYVQDKLQECSDYLCNLILNKSAHVYVCGDAESMARDMHRVLIDMIEYYQDSTTPAATAYLNKMQDEGRYQRDIWTSVS